MSASAPLGKAREKALLSRQRRMTSNDEGDMNSNGKDSGKVSFKSAKYATRNPTRPTKQIEGMREYDGAARQVAESEILSGSHRVCKAG